MISMVSFIKQLLQPVAIVWVVLVIMCGWQIYRRQFRWAYVNGLLVFGLFLFGSTPLAGKMLHRLERPYIRDLSKSVPSADAVVVLGGMVRGGQYEPLQFNVQDAMDRIFLGIDLARERGGIPLIVGGGSYGEGRNRKTEFSVLKPWIDRWNLADDSVLHLGMCANTHEEAQRVDELIKQKKWQSIYLVTSAYHMRRAEAVFRTVGVKAVPVACDFQGSAPNKNGRIDVSFTILPQSSRLNLLRVYLHEQVGWLYYRSRGWIKAGK